MQSEKLEQKNEIAELLGIQDKLDEIGEKDEGFVIKNIHNLDSRKHKIAEVLQKHSVVFKFCSFDFLCLDDLEIKNPAMFLGCDFNSNCNVSFKKTKFYRSVSFKRSSFEGSVDFSDSRFYEQADFSDASFQGGLRKTTKFNNSKFKEQADFSDVYFGQDTYFHRCVFYDDLQIYRARFVGVANFYFASFNNGGIPNFSACVFENPKLANFVGVDLTRFQKKDIESYVRKKSKIEVKQEENKKKKRIEEELRVQHARNIKDSFRVLKDVLLVQNNGLEAQVWHKIELYAKEVEIEFLIEKDQRTKNQGYKKLDLIFDKSILYFYRLISDHHNNFSKILNVTIYTIVFHSVFVLTLQHIVFKRFFSSALFVYSATGLIFFPIIIIAIITMIGGYFSIKKSFVSKSIIDTTFLLIISFLFLLFIAFFDGNLLLLYSIGFSIVCIYGLFFFASLSWLNFSSFRFFVCALFACIFVFNPGALNPSLGIFKENPLTNVILKDYIETNDIGRIQNFLRECEWTKKRFDDKVNNYLSLKSIMLSNSKLFLEMCSKEDKKKKNTKKQGNLSDGFELVLIQNELFNQILDAINMVYLALLILCIFSLQKTARKNSIIPN